MKYLKEIEQARDLVKDGKDEEACKALFRVAQQMRADILGAIGASITLETPISALKGRGFSSRLVNCLVDQFGENAPLREALEAGDVTLQRIPNFGSACLRAVDKLRERFGVMKYIGPVSGYRKGADVSSLHEIPDADPAIYGDKLEKMKRDHPHLFKHQIAKPKDERGAR